MPPEAVRHHFVWNVVACPLSPVAWVVSPAMLDLASLLGADALISTAFSPALGQLLHCPPIPWPVDQLGVRSALRQCSTTHPRPGVLVDLIWDSLPEADCLLVLKGIALELASNLWAHALVVTTLPTLAMERRCPSTLLASFPSGTFPAMRFAHFSGTAAVVPPEVQLDDVGALPASHKKNKSRTNRPVEEGCPLTVHLHLVSNPIGGTPIPANWELIVAKWTKVFCTDRGPVTSGLVEVAPNFPNFTTAEDVHHLMAHDGVTCNFATSWNKISWIGFPSDAPSPALLAHPIWATMTGLTPLQRGCCMLPVGSHKLLSLALGFNPICCESVMRKLYRAVISALHRHWILHCKDVAEVAPLDPALFARGRLRVGAHRRPICPPPQHFTG